MKFRCFSFNTKSENVFASIEYFKLIDECYFFHELPKHLLLVENNINTYIIDVAIIQKVLFFPQWMHILQDVESTWEWCFKIKTITQFSPVFPLYRSQSIDLHHKLIDWFLYNRNNGLTRIKSQFISLLQSIKLKNRDGHSKIETFLKISHYSLLWVIYKISAHVRRRRSHAKSIYLMFYLHHSFVKECMTEGRAGCKM